MMKIILYLVVFLLLGTGLVFGVDHFYDRFHQTTSFEEKSVKENQSINAINKTDNHLEDPAVNLPQNIIEKTPPHFLPGFDWRLPKDTLATDYSGLIGDENNDPSIVKNTFIIVRWDQSNPRAAAFDFSRLESKLKRIAPQPALIRLEVNSSCEAPKWALQRLRQSSKKSLIFWDDVYLQLTQPFIQAFASRYAAHPQIIGVQLGLGDGEFGDAPDSCENYSNKRGWGEFWMSPSERQEAEQRFGFNPDVFEAATKANVDLYAKAFGVHKNKLAFTNLGTLFTYGEGAEPYNQKLKTIANYVLKQGLGNRDGAIERWMSYTDKVYGTRFSSMPDGSCLMDFDENFTKQIRGRYWGTENEFYGNKDYVINEMGPVENHPYIFMISSLRTLQMRRNYLSITDMQEINHVDYKTQEFLRYLYLTLGKNISDTPDAFLLMGERYIAPYRLADQMDIDCVNKHKDKVTVRSFGRWLSESPMNTQIENKPALKVTMPESENHWYQGYYLPDGIDYEYFARESKQFAFDLNDQLSKKRCKVQGSSGSLQKGCLVDIKATFKDTVKTQLTAYVEEGKSATIQTLGDNKIKTVTFTLQSQFKNGLAGSDIVLKSNEANIPLILLRVNFI